MKKLIKIFSVVIVTILAITVAGGTLLGLYVDPNDYKQEIQKLALERANLNLTIEGDINWSVFPWLGLDISDVKASYPEQAPLASVEKAQVSVLLQPLLSGEVKMKTLNIDGLVLTLNKSQNGVSNWQPKPQSVEQKKTDDSANTTTQAPEDKTSDIKIDIESIAVNNATIIYNDEQTATRHELKQLKIATNRIILGQPFNAKISFDSALKQGQKNVLTTRTEIQSDLLIDLAKQRFQLQQFNAKSTLTSDKVLDIALSANIDANLAADEIKIENLVFKLFDLETTANLNISHLKAAPTLTGQIAAKEFNLKALLAQLKLPPIITKDNSALSRASLSTEITGDLNEIALSQLKFHLDDTLLTGAINITPLTQFIHFNLQGNQIDLNRYLPPAAIDKTPVDNSASAPKPAGVNYSKENIIPLPLLRSLAIAGQLSLEKLKLQKTTIENINLKISADKGLIKIPQLNAHVYGGTVSNNIVLDARKKSLALSIDNRVQSLQLGPVLTDFTQSSPLTGKLSSQSKLTARGNSIHSMVNTLSGNNTILLADGLIEGVDAAQQMCETINKVASLGGVVSKTQAVDKTTPFASINGNFNIKNGVISNDDFKADLDALNINGRGNVSLPEQQLDYRLALIIKDNLFKKSCSVNNEIQNIEWPVNCKGRFSDAPTTLCKPDLSVVEDILKKALKVKLEKKLGASIEQKKAELKKQVEAKKAELKQKVEEQLKNEVEDKAKNLLKGLF